MKKFTWCLILLGLGALTFAGCGGDKGGAKKAADAKGAPAESKMETPPAAPTK